MTSSNAARPRTRHDVQCDVALTAARRAIDDWPRLTRDQRRGLIHSMLGLLEDLHSLGLIAPTSLRHLRGHMETVQDAYRAGGR